MVNVLRSYLDIILQERFWSWSLIGILYVILGLMVRGWFLNSMIRRAKEVGSKYYHEIKKAYLKRSLLGWILFFIPLGILIVLWSRGMEFPLDRATQIWVHIAIASYTMSVISHMWAFGTAGIVTLKLLAREAGIQEALQKA